MAFSFYSAEKFPWLPEETELSSVDCLNVVPFLEGLSQGSPKLVASMVYPGTFHGLGEAAEQSQSLTMLPAEWAQPTECS